MNLRFEQAMDYRTLWRITGGFLLVILGIWYRSGKLQHLQAEPLNVYKLCPYPSSESKFNYSKPLEYPLSHKR